MGMGSVISIFSTGHAPQRRLPALQREEREICYRYPAVDELSEVSCGPEPRGTMSPRTREARETRRTS